MRKARSVILVLLSIAPVAMASNGPAEEEGFRPSVRLGGLVDARLVYASEPAGWLDGGVGRTRFGGAVTDGDGIATDGATAFRLGQLSLVADAQVREDLGAHVQLNVDAEQNRAGGLGRIGLVEGFVNWSPVLSSRTRLRVRAGVTIPPFSLEHPNPAWSTQYSLTPSAIGSWIGEELKSTGLETTLILSPGGFTEIELQVAGFSGNDSTGALLAWRGWALHDRQGQLNDELPFAPLLSLTEERFFSRQGLRTRPFREIDGRPGYHAQGRARFGARGQLQAGYYDSNGDPSKFDGDYTWETSFFIVGGELNVGPLTLLAQYLDGDTGMGPKLPARVDAPIRAGYAMASVSVGNTRLTARYDAFEVRDEDVWLEGKDLNDDEGWAATGALIQTLGDGHKVFLEYVHVDADRPFNATADMPTSIRQDQVQLAWRLTF